MKFEKRIGAVVEIEPAQVKLVRFPRAGMLRDDHARHRLHDLARPQQRTQGKLFMADDAFIGGTRDADEAVGAARDDHLFDPFGGCGLLCGRGARERGDVDEKRRVAQEWSFHVMGVGLFFHNSTRHKKKPRAGSYEGFHLRHRSKRVAGAKGRHLKSRVKRALRTAGRKKIRL